MILPTGKIWASQKGGWVIKHQKNEPWSTWLLPKNNRVLQSSFFWYIFLPFRATWRPTLCLAGRSAYMSLHHVFSTREVTERAPHDILPPHRNIQHGQIKIQTHTLHSYSACIKWLDTLTHAEIIRVDLCYVWMLNQRDADSPHSTKSWAGGNKTVLRFGSSW